MQPNTSEKKFTEQTLRQVAADAKRALMRARYCVDRTQIERFSCVDDSPETDTSFGHQLWFFEGVGIDELDRRMRIFGAMEYSLQYGLHEMVEDGVFEASDQRERFRQLYRGHRYRPTWNHPAHRWLLFGVTMVSTMLLVYAAYRWAF